MFPPWSQSATPAACICVAQANWLLAAAFASHISIRKGKHQVDAKSMLEIITLSASPGSKLTVSDNGPDAQSALDAVVSFFDNNLGDP